MKGAVAIVFMYCLFLDLQEATSRWEIQNLNIPQGHIPYFRGSKYHQQGLCKTGSCQVTNININLNQT